MKIIEKFSSGTIFIRHFNLFIYPKEVFIMREISDGSVFFFFFIKGKSCVHLGI